MDRIDITVHVHRPSAEALAARPGQESAKIRAAVVEARERQAARLEGTGVACNADMDAKLVRRDALLDEEGEAVLAAAYERTQLSARGHERVLKVARTIADLASSERVRAEHVGQALTLRGQERTLEVVA